MSVIDINATKYKTEYVVKNNNKRANAIFDLQVCSCGLDGVIDTTCYHYSITFS